MPGAEIAFNQAANPIPYGTPGVARDDIWQLQPVVCQSALSGNTSYAWSFLDVPPGSAATLTGANTATATFTPDLLGTYRIQLLTDGGGLGNQKILVIRVRYNNAGALQQNGICLPAFGERAGEDNVLNPPITGPQNPRGYAPFFEYLLAYILTLSGGGGGAGPVPGILNATGNLAMPSVNSVYLVESAASLTQTFTGTPTDGLELTFIDFTRNCSSYPFYIVCQGSSVAQYPASPSATAATISTQIAGSAFTLKWSASGNKWAVKNSSFGYTYPYSPSWNTGADDSQFWTNVSAGVYQGSGLSYGSLQQEWELTDATSVLTGPFTYQAEASSVPFLTIFRNSTAYPATVTNTSNTGSVLIPSGAHAVVFSDGVTVDGVILSTSPALVLPTVFDGSYFEPSAVAPATANRTTAKTFSAQLTNATPTNVYTIPLPGTAGSAIPSITTPSLFSLDVSVRMQSTTTVDSAWFKLTWAWSLAVAGTANALGASAIAALSIGNSVATAQALPAGWAATLTTDGTNAYVRVTGDPALVVNISGQAEWNDLE